MHVNLKILFLSFTLALFLVPGISLACSKKDKQILKSEAHAETFIKQSFAKFHPSCDSGDCKEECCHPKSHNCQTEGCSGNCSGNLCGSFHYTILADSKFLEDSRNQAPAYDSNNSNFYYQNPSYSGGFHTIWQPPKIG
ncbi:hypothetical protein QF004_001645 [Chryseobacterium sp. MDT2-18]|nr:hypothetical protein [Chryseobacterium sp. MDT2-18]